MRVLLFDIDGTLLDCGPQVRPLFAAALEDVFGITGDIDAYDFAGGTDQRIVLDLLTRAGLPAEEVTEKLPRYQRVYLERLEAGLDPDRVRVLDGVVDLLDDLAARDDVVLALLTGNFAGGARLKLATHGLDRYFAFGAFGCDGVDRDELPPVALRRARAYVGREVEVHEALLIGDSVPDVTCAAAHGVPMVAVATGRTSPERLRAAGAERVLPSLVGSAEELLGSV